MPIDKGREGGDRPPDDWQRIESEWDERARAQHKWDAEHDPSPEWEAAARPLPPDYGLDRPRHREIPPEVAAAFGRTPEQLQALREKMFEELEARRDRMTGEADAGAEDATETGHGADEPAVAPDHGTEQEAPRVSDERVRELLDQLPARAEGRPTTAMVFDTTGYLGTEQSGGVPDSRAETAESWLDEGGWKRSARRVETHAEAKVVVDMIEGRLPRHVMLVINNEVCREVNPRIASCEAFIRESLPQGYSLRIYENNENERYFEGTR